VVVVVVVVVVAAAAVVVVAAAAAAVVVVVHWYVPGTMVPGTVHVYVHVNVLTHVRTLVRTRVLPLVGHCVPCTQSNRSQFALVEGVLLFIVRCGTLLLPFHPQGQCHTVEYCSLSPCVLRDCRASCKAPHS
jgi:hypothetical protein